jgi:GPH family glycoside/pentoside/hexuronide:cation symporter
MSKNIMHSRHDEYHKLTRGERIGYGMGDFAQKPGFSAQLGFLSAVYADGKYHQHGNAGFIFLFVRIINVFWDPMVEPTWINETRKAGNIVRATSWRAAGDPVGITVRANPGVKGSVAFAFIIYLALDLVYSLVNIPYGSLNASLTRDRNRS